MIINASNLMKQYSGEILFEDVSFSVKSRDKIGLIGANGCGKTTLMNIIGGKVFPDSGQVNISSDLTMGFLEQSPRFKEKDTVYSVCLEVFADVIEMIDRLRELEQEMADKADLPSLESVMDQYSKLTEKFQNRGGYSYNSAIKGTLKGLGFDEDQYGIKVSTLSGGQKSRLHLAALLLQKPDILLLDEPTNHLDMEGTRYLEAFLSAFEGTVIIISHDRYFLDKVVNKIFHMEMKRLWVYKGNYSQSMKTRYRDMEIRRAAYEKQQAEVSRQEEIIKRLTDWGGIKNIRRAQSRQKQLDRVEILEKPTGEDHSFNLRFTPAVESGREVMEAVNLSKSYGSKQVLDGISFEVYKGNKVGIIGGNGVGKTTLMKIVTGEESPSSGHISFGTNVSKGYYDQEQENLNYSNTVLEEVLEDEDLTITEARTILGSFRFRGDDVFKEVSQLSGGEKGRLHLLKVMLASPNLLLMDEPTNHLDIDSKEILEEALKAYSGTLLVVSHDRYFLNQVVDKILLLESGKASIFQGNYDYYESYIAKLEEAKDEDEPTETRTSIKKSRSERNRQKRDISILRRKVKKLEDRMEEIQGKIDSLEEESFKPEIYSDYKKIGKIQADIIGLEKELVYIDKKWLEKSLELEELDD